MIEAGTYTATVSSHAITLTKSGDPQVVVHFDIKGHGNISYYGYFTDKAREYTINNLIKLGLQGDNPAGALQIGKEVELVLVNESYKGKDSVKVRFINLPGERKEVEAVPIDMAKAKLAALEGAVVLARSKLNMSEEIPF